jgi:Rrf2 family protein
LAIKLTHAADYAIRGMLFIASFPEERPVLGSEVSEAGQIPRSFTAKILRRLVRAGLLKSSRGVSGGFKLARPGAEISLLDIVQAIEGPLAVTRCTLDPERCDQTPNCPAHGVWAAVQAQILQTLGTANLEQLVSAPRKRGRVSLEAVSAAGS